MGNKLFVGNLDYSTTDQQLLEAFAQFGNVVSATVIIDRMTGRSRGFGFVEYDNSQSAQEAINNMDGADLQGRQIAVNEARERRNGGGGGHGGGRGGHDRGGRGGDRGGRGGGRRDRGRGGGGRW